MDGFSEFQQQVVVINRFRWYFTYIFFLPCLLPISFKSMINEKFMGEVILLAVSVTPTGMNSRHLTSFLTIRA
jgi:hypothetical protein